MKKFTLNPRLASYGALATTAALFSSLSVDAQVMYTDITDETLIDGASYLADIDNDGVDDFSFQFRTTTAFNQPKMTPATSGNSFLASAGFTSGFYYLKGLVLNDNIAASNTSWGSGTGVFASNYGGQMYGNWIDNADHYVGIKFAIGTATHYGWVRVHCTTGTSPNTVTDMTIKDWAYQATPDVAIAAGAMGVGVIDNTITDVNVWSYNNNININFNDVSFNDAKIEVYNTSGQLVLTEVAVSSKTTLTLNAAAGIYTVNIIANGQVKNQKVLIK